LCTVDGRKLPAVAEIHLVQQLGKRLEVVVTLLVGDEEEQAQEFTVMMSFYLFLQKQK